MSISHKEDSGGGGVGGGGGGGCEIDGDEGEIDGPSKRDYPKLEIEHTCKEGKKASSMKLKDVKKKLVLPERWRRRRRRKKKSDGEVMNPSCFVCFKRPSTLDSSGDSPPSDPNSPEFSYGMLRSFMEKNGFYDKDCNPHLDDE